MSAPPIEAEQTRAATRRRLSPVELCVAVGVALALAELTHPFIGVLFLACAGAAWLAWWLDEHGHTAPGVAEGSAGERGVQAEAEAAWWGRLRTSAALGLTTVLLLCGGWLVVSYVDEDEPPRLATHLSRWLGLSPSPEVEADVESRSAADSEKARYIEWRRGERATRGLGS